MLTRRGLIRSACAAGVGFLFPDVVFAGGVAASPDWTRSLVLVELDGGNDGLNTVVPWLDATYIAQRPSLRIASGLVDLGSAPMRTGASTTTSVRLGLHPSLAPLQAAWSAGDLAVALGLGMDNPNRSHFRGIDIWNTGTASDVTANLGWLQRVLEPAATPATGFAAHAVLLERATSNPIAGPGVRTLAMSGPAGFLDDAAMLHALPTPGANAALQHVVQTNNDVVAARDVFQAKVGTPPTFATTFPSTGFGAQCLAVAQMIAAGLGIPVYKIHLSGFDTHSAQRTREKDSHDALLAQLAQGLAALRAALVEKGAWGSALIATYSEFGRRVEENGSAGTDHGTAAPHLVLGSSATINGGLYGVQPGLGYLDGRGDLIMTSDYRRLYATAARFLGYDATAALGATFPRLGEGSGETTPLLKP